MFVLSLHCFGMGKQSSGVIACR